MKITVKLFARARDLVGAESVELDLPDGANVGKLRSALGERCPELRPLASSLLVAVANDYADDQTRIEPDDELACFPPVSGG
ncbi:MAG: MoaD/ThiS family protein [Planctomycetaceae bacterium]